MSKKDGIHYNRKYHRWELWINNDLIYMRWIHDEDLMEARKATVKMAKNMYNYEEVG